MSYRQIFLTSFLALSLCQAPARAEEKGVTSSVLINAPQATVWEKIRDTKHFDNKIESHVPNEAIVEQRFRILPILGEATATLKVKTVPKTRIDFKLIHSDQLKELSGTWILTPLSASQTKLQLTSDVDPGLPIPKILINHFVHGKVKGRLHKVKLLAEEAARSAENPTQTVH